MENILRWSKITLGGIPGLSVLFYHLGMPNEIDYQLVGGVMTALGCFTLIYISHINKTKPDFHQVSKKASIYFIGAFIVGLIGYLIIFDQQVAHNSKYDEKILVPFFRNDSLKALINKTGSINNLINEYGPRLLKDEIDKGPLALTITKLVFIFLFIVVLESLIIAFGLVTLKPLKVSKT